MLRWRREEDERRRRKMNNNEGRIEDERQMGKEDVACLVEQTPATGGR